MNYCVVCCEVPLGSCYNWCPGQDSINREQELRREKKVFFLLHCSRTDGYFSHLAMKSVTKRNRRKSQREAARLKRQGAPGPTSDDEDVEVHFKQAMTPLDSPPASPPPSPTSQGETDYAIVLDMVQNLRDKLSALNLDNENIRVTHRAHRSSARNSSVNNPFGVSPKRTGSSKPSLRCVQISPASATPRTSTVRRNRCSC